MHYLSSYFFSLFLLFFSVCEARVNFLHIPKTGGTTLSSILKENYPIYQFYPYVSLIKPLPERAKSIPVLQTIEELPLIQEKVAWGHFPFWFFLEKDPDIDESFFFTCLRDPVDRVLSSDRHKMRYDASRGLKPISNPTGLPPNGMCRMLCSSRDLEGEELLEDCMRTLERMDFIVFMEDYANGVKELCRRLHLRCPSKVPHLNITKKHHVSEEMIELVRERNSLDIRLYEYAKERFLLPRLSREAR